MNFSVAQQRVTDPESGLVIEFLAQDTLSRDNAQYADAAIVGMRISNTNDEDGTVAHFRFNRNGKLLSVLEERTDGEGNVLQRDVPIVQDGQRTIPVAGGYGETVQTAGHGQTVASRGGLEFMPVERAAPQPESLPGESVDDFLKRREEHSFQPPQQPAPSYQELTEKDRKRFSDALAARGVVNTSAQLKPEAPNG